jgi:hypothetical protein
LNMTRNYDWFERGRRKCLRFDVSQFGIRFEWNRWKWTVTREAFWTKNLNVARNSVWSNGPRIFTSRGMMLFDL